MVVAAVSALGVQLFSGMEKVLTQYEGNGSLRYNDKEYFESARVLVFCGKDPDNVPIRIFLSK